MACEYEYLTGPVPGLELTTVPPVDPVTASNVGGWALLAIVLAILIYELWAIWTGGKTISQWVKGKTRGRRWWKGFGVVAIGLLLWHLFEGGPL